MHPHLEWITYYVVIYSGCVVESAWLVAGLYYLFMVWPLRREMPYTGERRYCWVIGTKQKCNYWSTWMKIWLSLTSIGHCCFRPTTHSILAAVKQFCDCVSSFQCIPKGDTLKNGRWRWLNYCEIYRMPWQLITFTEACTIATYSAIFRHFHNRFLILLIKALNAQIILKASDGPRHAYSLHPSAYLRLNPYYLLHPPHFEAALSSHRSLCSIQFMLQSS